MRIALAIALLALAGCVAPAADVDTAATDRAATAAAPEAMPYSFKGAFEAGGFVCAMVVCYGTGSGQTWDELDLDGNLTAVDLTMTWDATTPNMATLLFGIGYGTEGEFDWEYVEGSSPLVLQKADLDIPDHDEVEVFAWMPCKDPACALQLATPQSFLIEGTLTLE